MKTVKMFGKTIAPTAILAIVLSVVLVGVVFASYQVFKSTHDVTVLEPLEVTEIQAPGGSGVYAGGEIGLSQPNGGKYFIRNKGDQPITVIITVTEKSGQMAWYGFKGCYATTGYSGADTCDYAHPIVDKPTGRDCWSTGPESQVWSCTFELGTKDYVYADLIGEGYTTEDIQYLIYAGSGDSSCAKFFVDGVVADDADPSIALNFVVTVERG